MAEDGCNVLLVGVYVTPAANPIPPERTKSRLVSERQFPRTVNLLALLHFLRNARSTGVLTIDLSQGGVNMIRFREEENVTSP